MNEDERTVRGFAARLRASERTGTAAPLASEVFPDLDWRVARLVARERDALRLEDGDDCIGYKLGWTSAAMREALGIDRPNWGTLWRSQRIEHRLGLATLRHAKVEPEIVYVAGGELVGDDVRAVDVCHRAAGWAVGIEVVHPRWNSFDFTWLDNTADNSSAEAVVVGAVHQLDVDPSTVEVSFSNGSETRCGRGEQTMGSPADAVAWLARQLAVEGCSITAGDIVFTGGLTAPFDLAAGSRYAVCSSRLGTAELTTESDPRGHPRWPE